VSDESQKNLHDWKFQSDIVNSFCPGHKQNVSSSSQKYILNSSGSSPSSGIGKQNFSKLPKLTSHGSKGGKNDLSW